MGNPLNMNNNNRLVILAKNWRADIPLKLYVYFDAVYYMCVRSILTSKLLKLTPNLQECPFGATQQLKIIFLLSLRWKIGNYIWNRVFIF